ncbi:MAG: hypothetical protein JNL90_01470 [Planctomycetes bacterium]|nr:hypothetical protein [Planctomycetota bacterium]
MEEEIFPHPAVRRVLTEKFIESRLHTDHDTLGEKWIEIERGYIGYHSQSYYIVIDPKTRTMLRHTEFNDSFKSDPQSFADWLEGK